MTRPPRPPSPARVGVGRRIVRYVALPLLATAVLACGEEPTGLEGIRSKMIVVPSFYSSLWKRIETCSGHVGDFDRVRWFTTPYFPGNSDILGQWNSRHEITIKTSHMLNEGVVGHEILHDLLNGDGDHSDPAWDACDLPKGVG